MTERDHVEGAVAARALPRQRGQNRAPEGPGSTCSSDVGKEFHASTLPFRLCRDNTFLVVYQAGNGPDHGRMDATEARTHHIRRLVEESGGPVKFSEKVKGRWQPAQISQWTSEKNPKGIGRQIARELESILELPEASLDRPPETPSESQSGGLNLAKLNKAQEFLEDLFEAENVEFVPSERTLMLAAVYDELLTTSTPNMVEMTLRYRKQLTGGGDERQRASGSVGKDDRGRAGEGSKKAKTGSRRGATRKAAAARRSN